MRSFVLSRMGLIGVVSLMKVQQLLKLNNKRMSKRVTQGPHGATDNAGSIARRRALGDGMGVGPREVNGEACELTHTCI